MSRDQLSDNWRRTRCRFAFLFFCILPTAFTVYWIFHPQTAENWEQIIQAELGLPTSIDSIETPGPHVTVLRGVQFTDSQYGTLFKATQIRVIRESVNRIVVDYPTQFSHQALTEMVSHISDHLTRGDRVQRAWKIEFRDTVTIYSDEPQTGAGPALVTKDLTITIDRYKNGPGAIIDFWLVNDNPTQSRVQCYVHNGLGSKQQFGIQTGSSELPCWLLSDIVPDLKHLGDECVFSGEFKIQPSEQDIEETVCQLSGMFRRIDLAALVLPYRQKMTGLCTVGVPNLLIKNGRIQTLEAKVHCPQGGVISQDLLESAQQHLGFQLAAVTNRQAESDGSVYYQDLHLDFKIKSGHLFLSGDTEGIIAYSSRSGQPLVGCQSVGSDNQPFFQQPPSRTLDDLANFLVRPQTNTQLVSEEAFSLLDRFHRSATPLASESPTRMAEENNGTTQF